MLVDELAARQSCPRRLLPARAREQAGLAADVTGRSLCDGAAIDADGAVPNLGLGLEGGRITERVAAG